MICPECKRLGQRSKVYPGMCTSTLMAVSRYYDEDGNLHTHDPNKWRTQYRCSRGHAWIENRRNECKACKEKEE